MSKKSLKINNDIYNEDIILQAIKDYKDIALIRYQDWEIVVSSQDYDEDKVINEFMNYVIWLQNETI